MRRKQAVVDSVQAYIVKGVDESFPELKLLMKLPITKQLASILDEQRNNSCQIHDPLGHMNSPLHLSYVWQFMHSAPFMFAFKPILYSPYM